jgi:hypothetical protein
VPPQAAGLVTVGPGSSSAVTVREPALNLLVTRAGAPLAGANVRITAKAAGCGGVRTMTTNAAGELTLVGAPSGSLNPGLPYGTYDVCVDRFGVRATLTGVDNTDPAGTPLVTLAIPTVGLGGTCP